MRTMLLVTLVSVIGSLLAFDQFFLMTAGQPFNQTATSVYCIYLNSFPYLRLGYGAALSLILATIILAFTVVQVVLTRRSHAEMSTGSVAPATAELVRSRRSVPACSRAAIEVPRGRGLRGAVRDHAAADRAVGDPVAEDDAARQRHRRRPGSQPSSASIATSGCGTTSSACRRTCSTAWARRCSRSCSPWR